MSLLTREFMLDAAKIAKRCYSKPEVYISSSSPTHVLFEDQPFELAGVYKKGGVWIYKSSLHEHAKQKWIVGIRGTHTMSDIAKDTSLVKSIRSPKGSSTSSFNDIAVKFAMNIDAILTEEGCDVTKHDVLFIGHSLGSTLIESYIHVRGGNMTKHTRGVCFDSPGLPLNFISQYPHHSDKIFIINSKPNFVNTLSQPNVPQRNFYAIDYNPLKDDDGDKSSSLARLLFKGLRSPVKVYSEFVKSHSMDDIINALKTQKTITQPSPASWPTQSHTIVTAI